MAPARARSLRHLDPKITSLLHSNWADEVLVTCVWEALDVSGRGYCSRKLMTDDVEARLNGGLRDRASVRQLGSFNQDNETLLGSAGRFRPPDRPRLT
jgi:hypothetical protein